MLSKFLKNNMEGINNARENRTENINEGKIRMQKVTLYCYSK